MKILLSAFSCNPNKGSEPGKGWAVAEHLGQRHSVHVLTKTANRVAIENALTNRRDLDRLSFSYYGTEKPSRGSGVKVNLYYHYWQQKIASWARESIEEFQPDVIHHITLARYWTPSSLAFLGIPFIFGPIGGADEIPASFKNSLTLRGRASGKLRALVQLISEQNPRLKKMVKSSSLVLPTTEATSRKIEKLGASNVFVMSPCGLVPTVIETLQKIHDPNIPQKHFTICSRLLAWKGIHLSLQAFNRCKDLNVDLHIFGSGPEKQKLQGLATNLGIDDRVTFHGHVSRQKLLEWLPSSIALLHPSLQESGGMACLEALAARVPVICLNHGGPPMLVPGDAGFVISPESPEQVIKEMSEKMRLLASNPELHIAMGKRGQEKAINSHTWTVKLNAIYERFNTTQLKR